MDNSWRSVKKTADARKRGKLQQKTHKSRPWGRAKKISPETFACCYSSVHGLILVADVRQKVSASMIDALEDMCAVSLLTLCTSSEL